MNGKMFGFSVIRRPDRVDAILSEIRAKARQLETRSERVLQSAREGSAVTAKDCPECGTSTPHCRIKNGKHVCGICGTEH